MTYRIRYRKTHSHSEVEAVIEANSPAEAMVKFRCMQGSNHRPSKASGDVTSVTAIDPNDTVIW